MDAPEPGSPEWAAQDHGPVLLRVLWIITGFAFLFVAARLYVRGYLLRRFHLDDYFSLLSFIALVVSVVFGTLSIHYGSGRHYDTLSTHQKKMAMFYTTLTFPTAIITFAFPKVVIVSLLVRLLSPRRGQVFFLWGMVFFFQLVLIVGIALLFGTCSPPAALWDPAIKNPKCMSKSIAVNFGIFAGALSSAMDFYLASYPAIVLYGLNMNLKKKIVLSCALGVGAGAGILSIYRCTQIARIESEDLTYETPSLVLWAAAEGCFLLVASSVPILQPLLEQICRNPFHSSNHDSSATNENGRYHDFYHKQHSSDRHALPDGWNIELGVRRPKPKQRDELGLTILDNEDSQEDILFDNRRGDNNNTNNDNHNIAPETSDIQTPIQRRPSAPLSIRTTRSTTTTCTSPHLIRSDSSPTQWQNTNNPFKEFSLLRTESALWRNRSDSSLTMPTSPHHLLPSLDSRANPAHGNKEVE